MTNIDKKIEKLKPKVIGSLPDKQSQELVEHLLERWWEHAQPKLRQALLDIQKETAKQNYAEGYKQGRFDEKMDNLNITGEDYE